MSSDPNTEQKLRTLAQWIAVAENVVWFTGAGISTESGMPDFRGPDGVWTRRDKGLAPPESKPLSAFEPNPAHYAICQFEAIGKCAHLVSQNVDNLHLKSGFPGEKLSELHGNITRVRCRLCTKTYASPKYYRGKWCPECSEPLEESIVDFGEPLPRAALSSAFEAAESADLMIVVGSSCRVHPAADIPHTTKRRGGRLVIMNIGNTSLDSECDLRFDQERVGQLLPRLFDIVSEELRPTQ